MPMSRRDDSLRLQDMLDTARQAQAFARVQRPARRHSRAGTDGGRRPSGLTREISD